MNKDQFIETYCHNCGTQRCEGIDSEWFEGCEKRWNFDDMDPAAEIKRLNDKIMELAGKLVNMKPVKHGEWIRLSEPCIVDGIKQIHVECSNCKIQRYIPAVEQHGYYFCNNCGARMDGGNSNARKDWNKQDGIKEPRCHKCVYEITCKCNRDYDRKCPDYKRDPKDGGFYG